MQRHLIMGQDFVTVLPMLQAYPSVDVMQVLDVAYSIRNRLGDDSAVLLSPPPHTGRVVLAPTIASSCRWMTGWGWLVHVRWGTYRHLVRPRSLCCCHSHCIAVAVLVFIVVVVACCGGFVVVVVVVVAQ